jgi:hypothetical protein
MIIKLHRRCRKTEPTLFLNDLNHPMRALEQRFGAVIRYEDRPAPRELNALVRGHGNGLPDKRVAFFYAQIAQVIASESRGQ